MLSIIGRRTGWNALRAKGPPNKRKRKRKTRLKCYRERDEKLLLIGYLSYENYLKSPLWKEIRYKKLDENPNCVLCNKPASQVHHLDYTDDTLVGRCDYRLVQLCRDCHHQIEFEGCVKLSVRRATGKLYKLASKSHRGRKWIRWTNHQKVQYRRDKRIRDKAAKKATIVK